MNNCFIKKLIPVMAFLILCFNVFSQQASGQTYTISEHAKKVIDSTYNALIKSNKIIGASIAIVDHGVIVYATGYGLEDKAKNIKADENTLYRIGSCTKSFTAMSVMQLQEKQLVDVNQSIKNYLPTLKIGSRFNDGNEIYIKDMLTHVSGLPCDIGKGFFCDSPPDMKWVINELNKQTTMSPRFYKHAYSNIAFGLLGELVAVEGKTTYSNYVRDNIFTPLNMKSSFIEYDSTLAKKYSKAYVNNKEIKEPLIRDQGAGLIHSSVSDMAHYLIMYLNNGVYENKRIISEESLKQMEENHIKNITLKSNQSWGYGLYTKKVSVKHGKDTSYATLIGHGGDTYAFHSDFQFIPELGIGAVILTNTDHGQRIANAAKIIKIYMKESKGDTIDLNYKDTANKPLVTGETACTNEEILGKYNLGDLLIDVTDPKRIKFKQGPIKVVLLPDTNGPSSYSARIVLLKIIPIKMKNVCLKFVKLNEQIYLKQGDAKSKNFSFIAKKINPASIPDTWKSKYGNYKLTANTFPCTNCPYGNFDGYRLTLSEDKGFVVMKTKGKTPDTNDNKYLDVLSDDLCVTGGIGRGTGETIRLLGNGNIYYSGFEFKKIK